MPVWFVYICDLKKCQFSPMEIKRKINQLLLILALPGVLWLYFGQAAFWHYHVLENGIVIEHSHPFKNNPLPGTPFQNHQHSDFEYSVLTQLSNVFSLLVFLLVLGLIPLKPVMPNLTVYAPPATQPVYLLSNRLRGPPHTF
jgi:hypothetical protein